MNLIFVHEIMSLPSKSVSQLLMLRKALVKRLATRCSSKQIASRFYYRLRKLCKFLKHSDRLEMHACSFVCFNAPLNTEFPPFAAFHSTRGIRGLENERIFENNDVICSFHKYLGLTAFSKALKSFIFA